MYVVFLKGDIQMIICKKTLSIILCGVILIGTIVILGANVFADGTELTYDIGDMVTFGSYPQKRVSDSSLKETLANASLEDGFFSLNSKRYFRYENDFYEVEPINWTVYKKSDDGIFILANSILDSCCYDEVYFSYSKWLDKSLRSWLNDYFYNNAFSEEEKSLINTNVTDYNWSGAQTIDYVFVPGYMDLNTEGNLTPEPNFTMVAHATSFAFDRGSGNDWWLRDGYKNTYNTRPFYISETGQVLLLGNTFATKGIRPSIKLKTNNVEQEESTNGFKVGDIIEYGSYPKSDVTDSMGYILDQLNGTWVSYRYYSGPATENSIALDGTMEPSDYMRYKDVTYNGNKYRGVIMDAFRPQYTSHTTATSNPPMWYDSNQAFYGYKKGKIYWFKYEPIKWRILDPSDGLIMCDSVIDSQPFNNYAIQNGRDEHGHLAYWGNIDQTYYASDYANSSIRQWLNDDFYNTAFSPSQKTNIKTTVLNNDCVGTLVGRDGFEEYDSITTEDKVFLLSYADIMNKKYGFQSENEMDDYRKLKGSDYAKCQGLNFDEKRGFSYWILRTATADSSVISCISPLGATTGSHIVESILTIDTCRGICPALKLINLESNTDQDISFKATFVSNGYTILEKEYKKGEKIVKPDNPSRSGYKFVRWSPDVPAVMPAYDIKFVAIFEKNSISGNPTTNKAVKIYVPSDTKVEFGAKVTFIAKAAEVPDGYFVALYEGNTLLAKGDNTKVIYTFPGEIKSSKNLSVKIINDKEVVLKNSSGEDLSENVRINVNSMFFARLIAFFKRIFHLLPSVKIEPKQ